LYSIEGRIYRPLFLAVEIQTPSPPKDHCKIYNIQIMLPI